MKPFMGQNMGDAIKWNKKAYLCFFLESKEAYVEHCNFLLETFQLKQIGLASKWYHTSNGWVIGKNRWYAKGFVHLNDDQYEIWMKTISRIINTGEYDWIWVPLGLMHIELEFQEQKCMKQYCNVSELILQL